MKAAWERFVSDERGTETVEWAIMIGLIAVASIALIAGIGLWVLQQLPRLKMPRLCCVMSGAVLGAAPEECS